MKSKIILFFVALFAWCLLTWIPDYPHLVVGTFVAFLVAWMTGDLFIQRPHILKHPHRYWYFFFYFIPVFIWECMKANIDVACRIIHPQLPIHPGIVKVKTTLQSDTALTFLANAITLTPGTMSVDIDADNGVLYIHWIDVKAKDVKTTTKIIVERFEKILKKI
ncbi:MAG: Na+/H+ antiporter subunit E, partial [Candidatus Omnitrophica bacterium]|nr:Na+/H+ antiporter subunit E [Candidatus Omnitrophota bacterium]